MEVLFQGFKVVLGWHHSFQNNVQWALEVTTYSPIIGFLLLLLVSRWVLGEDALRRKDLNAAQVVDGMAPVMDCPEEIKDKWKRALNSILNFI